MQTSDQIDQIATALAKAQASIEPPKKDHEVRTEKYSYSYAALDGIVAALRGPLSENGLSFVQGVHQAEGQLVVETMLMHTSGQWIRSGIPVPGKSDVGAQALGSAISYAKRYGLSALLGVVAEDDDDAQRAEAEKGPRASAKGRARGQDATPVAETPRRPAFTTNQAAVAAWRAFNKSAAAAGVEVLANDFPDYPAYRAWLIRKISSALNEPVDTLSELSAEKIEQAGKLIVDWIKTGELKPWTIEANRQENA